MWTPPKGRLRTPRVAEVLATSACHGRAHAGFAGASYGYDDTKYGIPFVEEGLVELTPRRHMFGFKAGASELRGALEGYRVGLRLAPRYKHEELVAGEVGTQLRERHR